jgi:hypothetical protein
MQQELLAGADDLGCALAGWGDAFAHDEHLAGRGFVFRHDHADPVDAVHAESQRVVHRLLFADQALHQIGDFRQQCLALIDEAGIG